MSLELPAHLAEPPSPAFWLDELGFARLPAFLPLLDDPEALDLALANELHSPAVRDLVAAITERAPEPVAARLHLLLLAAYLEKKKTSAVRDVARAFLPADVLHRYRGDDDEHVQRVPLAVELYLREPRHLLAVEVAHRWHSQRRCAMQATGPRRGLPSPLGALPWADLGPAAVEGLPASLRVRHRPGWCLALPRDGGAEVLLAFRERADPAAVRDDHGRVRAGHRDGWTVLRFHREARRVDLTGRSTALGVALAEGVATRLWDTPIAYVPATGKLTGQALQEFLVRLRDPDDDTFRLLEIAAELTAIEERPLLTLGLAGQARVEPAMQAVRRSQAFAECWEAVHQVKVGFGTRHRIVVHFPAPDDPLALTYSDKERDKDVSRAFERLFREELGIEIHPKVARTRERKHRDLPEPTTYGPATWARLLGPVLDSPARWERDAIGREVQRGLLLASDHAVLRCGDAGVDRQAVGADTLDCPGEVELPYGQADPHDPFRQEDDCEVVCGTCGRPWWPGRYRVPLVHRVRVRVRHAETWGRLLEAAGHLGRFDEEAPGVASGLVGGLRCYLVYLPLAPDSWRGPAQFERQPACHVGRPGDPEMDVHGALGLDLAAFLADEKALERTLDLARERVRSDGYRPLPPRAPRVVADERIEARPAPGPEAGLPERAWISRDSRGVWLGTQPLATGRVNTLAQILALLGAAAAQDEGAGRERRFRPAEQLVRLAAGVSVGNVQTWVSRGRELIAKSALGPGLAEEIIESRKGYGYRLGARFEVVEMEVERVFGGVKKA